MFDTISEHICSDTTFVSGQNPYNTLYVCNKKCYQYNCSGDYRDARALIGRGLRHILLLLVYITY